MYVKKAGHCMKPCHKPYRRMSKSPYECRITKKGSRGNLSKRKYFKTSGGVAFIA